MINARQIRIVAATALSLGLTAAGCSSKRAASETDSGAFKPTASTERSQPTVCPDRIPGATAGTDRSATISSEARLGQGVTRHVPKAVVYQTAGNYRENVPVTVGPDGNITGYPAPSDINPDRLPVQLADGWLLDRRGVSSSTMFTNYTYSEYASLSAPPSIDRLKASIIPGSAPTRLLTLPVDLTTALADTAAVNRMILSSETK